MGRSSLDLLPVNFKDKINGFLADGDKTIDDLVIWLNQHGFQVSRSAMGRYSQRFKKTAERVRRTREMAEAIGQEADKGGESRTGRMIVELLQSALFDFLTTADQEDGGAPLDDTKLVRLTTSVRNLAQALSLDTKREAEIAERTKAKAAQAAGAVAVKEGLSLDTVEKIKNSILGVQG